MQTNVPGYNVRIVIQTPPRYGDEIIRVSLFAMHVVSTSNYTVWVSIIIPYCHCWVSIHISKQCVNFLRNNKVTLNRCNLKTSVLFIIYEDISNISNNWWFLSNHVINFTSNKKFSFLIPKCQYRQCLFLSELHYKPKLGHLRRWKKRR